MVSQFYFVEVVISVSFALVHQLKKTKADECLIVLFVLLPVEVVLKKVYFLSELPFRRHFVARRIG